MVRSITVFQVSGGLILLAGFAISLKFPELAFPRLGVILGLIAVVGLFFRDWLEKYEKKHSQGKDADIFPWKQMRDFVDFFGNLFVPLTIVAAAYQVIEPKNVAPDPANPDSFIYQPKGSTEWRIQHEALRDHLKNGMQRASNIDQRLNTLWFAKFLIVNCGAALECACPQPYKEVEAQNGKWNLNAGIAGTNSTMAIASDTLRLCWAEEKYPNTVSKP